jgi:aminobenzoyl-glutamate utilization protein B
VTRTTRRAWAEAEPRARRVAKLLWERPEPGLTEHHAAGLLTDWLAGQGFTVRLGVAGLPTAFIATAGTGGPRVGLLAEYDALPGLAADGAAGPGATASRRGPGHGCGHNLIAAANVAAAVAAASALRDSGAPGQVVVFGTPAEELFAGKLAMLRAGVFDPAEVLLTSHPDYQNAALSRPCAAVVSAEFGFTGRPGHTGWVVDGNALDAAEIFTATMERLRAHRMPGVSVEHVPVARDQVVPNVAPGYAGVWCYLRHREAERALAALDQLAALAGQAAAAAGVEASVTLLACSRGYLPNDELGRLLSRCLRDAGPPAWTLGELREMAALSADPAGGQRAALEPGPVTEGVDPYGQDDGEVSWQIPVGRVNWAVPAGLALHSGAATALFGTDAAWRGAAMASLALALAAGRLLASPDLVADCRAELAARVAARGPGPSRAGAVDLAALADLVGGDLTMGRFSTVTSEEVGS